MKSMKSKIADSPIGRKMTYTEFQHMEIPDGDTSLYELIQGVVVKRAKTNTRHQGLLGNLSYELGRYVEEKKFGKILPAPLDVVFDEENALLPDLLFISRERTSIIDPENGINGAPDLIVEVILKDSTFLDRGVKKDLYERFQVKEYWIADPLHLSVEVYSLVEGRFKLTALADGEGKITSSVLSGFELDIMLLCD